MSCAGSIVLAGRYSYSHHGVFPSNIVLQGPSNISFSIVERSDKQHSCWINRGKNVLWLERSGEIPVTASEATFDSSDASWTCAGGCLACSDQQITIVSAEFQIVSPAPPPSPPPHPTNELSACVVGLERKAQETPLRFPKGGCSSTDETVLLGIVGEPSICARRYAVATLDTVICIGHVEC